MDRFAPDLKRREIISVIRPLALFAAAWLAVSCDSPQRAALRQLNREGVEVSGRSLTDAVLLRDRETAGRLLEARVHLESRDTAGRTPLDIAMDLGDLDMVAMLINAGADPNGRRGRGSVLGHAIASGNAGIVSALMAAGARTDGLMPDGDPILPWAIRNGRLDLVRNLMESGADPHLRDARGNPLLHVAFESRRRDLVEALIELGADPGATNASGQTTIQLALANGWKDLAPKLAAAGADPNAPGPDGLTLLEKAYEDKDTNQMVFILKLGADPHFSLPGKDRQPVFERVFESGEADQLALLLRHSAAPASDWEPWLWRALERGELPVVRLLLAHGARPTGRGPEGMLAVEVATKRRSGDFLKLFLDHGLPVGRSFEWCLATGDHEMAGLLLAAGVSSEKTRFPTRETPLWVALAGGHDRLAALLVRHGADPKLILPEGQPALHLAVAKGCPETVRAILDRGGDPNAPFLTPVSPDFIRQVRPGVMRWALRMDRNATLLMLASDSGNIPTTRHLIRAGAKVNVRTKVSSLWPINFASRRGDVRMMRLFLGQDPHREERRIEVRLAEQRARVFDTEGREIFTTKVSTGRRGFATPTGDFVITNKHRDWTSTIYHASMPYFQRLSCGDFGLHQGYVPGYPASHGCIRVPPGNAAKLFALTRAGDRVSILP
jgi:ankyrin repeat protein